jgi:hypothetical protein
MDSLHLHVRACIKAPICNHAYKVRCATKSKNKYIQIQVLLINMIHSNDRQDVKDEQPHCTEVRYV